MTSGNNVFFDSSNNNIIYESQHLDNEYVNFLNNIFSLQPSPGQDNASSFNDVLNSSLNAPDQVKYKKVITEKAKDLIQIKAYVKNDYNEQLSCPMTLNDFKEGDDIAELPCGHIFEQIAIFKWLEEENYCCPVCRKKLPSKEIKIDKVDVIPQRQVLNTNQLLYTMINRELNRQDEEDLQSAIMSSLADISNN
mgnify:CR=1 FL=1|tara:strand:+ start:20121 stop:20702 length:582 start_codon:yes stop_codon:yes gene_type:complete